MINELNSYNNNNNKKPIESANWGLKVLSMCEFFEIPWK